MASDGTAQVAETAHLPQSNNSVLGSLTQALSMLPAFAATPEIVVTFREPAPP
jgi:hypothetical protein